MSRNKHHKNRSGRKSQKANSQFQRQFDKNAYRLFKKADVSPAPIKINLSPNLSSVSHRPLYVLFTLMMLTSCMIQQAEAVSSRTRSRDENSVAANELNQLYKRTTPCENDAPAYHCSGIIIHGQVVPDDDNPLPPWYLPAYRNVGSFSYLRADITSHVGEPVYINTGFILTPINKLEERRQFPYKLYCEFPGDGASVGDADSACHFNADNGYGKVCGKEIQTVDDFVEKYFDSQPPGSYWDQYDTDCSFLPTTDRFNLTMQLHKYIYRDNPYETYCRESQFCRVHNELIISAWDIKDVPDVTVPILAFYAIINDTFNPMFRESGHTSTSDDEFEQLFKDADAYSKATNYERRIPIVTLNMGKLRGGAEDVFAPAVRPRIIR